MHLYLYDPPVNGYKIEQLKDEANLALSPKIVRSIAFISELQKLRIEFESELDAGEKTTLDGVFSSHVPEPDEIVSQIVSIFPSSDAPSLIADSVSGTLTPGSWHRLDFTLEESFHIQGTLLQWENGEIGDRGWASVIHPLGQTNPTSPINPGDTTIQIGTGKGMIYGMSAAECVEIWDDTDTNLVEMIKIASVSGDTLTLSKAVAGTHSTSATLRCVIKTRAAVRGNYGIDGGFRILGSGRERFSSSSSMSTAIPVGFVLAIRIYCTGAGVSRNVVVNYRLLKD